MYMKQVFLGLLCCCTMLHAQDPLRVDFRMLSLGAPLEDLGLLSAEGMVELEVPSFERSDMVTYKGDALLRFIKKSEFVMDRPLPSSLFEVRIPDTIKNPLVIVTKTVDGHRFSYQAMVLPDNLDALPGGSSYFINASPYPVAILFDQSQEPVKLAPNAAFKRAFNESAHNIRVRIASYAEGEVRKGLDSRIYPLPIHRDIYFIYARSGGSAGRLMIRRLREHEDVAKRYIQKAAEEE
jgi:hypothetical protein